MELRHNWRICHVWRTFLGALGDAMVKELALEGAQADTKASGGVGAVAVVLFKGLEEKGLFKAVRGLREGFALFGKWKAFGLCRWG